MTSVFKEDFVKSTAPISKDDKLIQLFQNERYDVYAVFQSGRVFKQRARGQSGAYDNWVEVDIKSQINTDIKLQ